MKLVTQSILLNASKKVGVTNNTQETMEIGIILRTVVMTTVGVLNNTVNNLALTQTKMAN